MGLGVPPTARRLCCNRLAALAVENPLAFHLGGLGGVFFYAQSGLLVFIAGDDRPKLVVVYLIEGAGYRVPGVCLLEDRV